MMVGMAIAGALVLLALLTVAALVKREDAPPVHAAAEASDLAAFRDYVEDVVTQTCADCGLNRDAIGPQFDLAASGKFADVVALSARRIVNGHPLRTVDDLVTFLARLES